MKFVFTVAIAVVFSSTNALAVCGKIIRIEKPMPGISYNIVIAPTSGECSVLAARDLADLALFASIASGVKETSVCFDIRTQALCTTEDPAQYDSFRIDYK